jgi:hypothetical protein
MKKFTLVIDPSSSLDSGLYIYEAKTIKEAKEFLDNLNLDFSPGITYCATIGKKEPRAYFYHQILRTDNGIKWYRCKGGIKNFPYNPKDWLRVNQAQELIQRLQKKG